MPKPGPSETAGLRVLAWSLKDQPEDQKFPHPSGKTREEDGNMATMDLPSNSSWKQQEEAVAVL